MSTLVRHFPCSIILNAGIILALASQTSGQSSDANSKATGSISGYVTLNGKPVQGIPVIAVAGDNFNRRNAGARAVTDNDGRYRLFGLPAAQYEIMPIAPNLILSEQGADFRNYAGGNMIFLAPPEEVTDVDFHLVRGAVITGRISDADGKPVIEEQVHLQIVDSNGAIKNELDRYVQSNYQMFQTDDRGVYRIYGLPPGRYIVSVGSDATVISGVGRSSYFRQAFYSDATDAAKPTVIELSQGSEASNIDIRVGRRSQSYSVAGHVIDAETGQPVSGVRPTYGLVAKNQETSGSFFGGFPTNPRGEFRMDGLQPGHYTLYVSSRFEGGNYYSDPIFFDVIDSDVTNLEIKAIQGVSINGVVVSESDANKNSPGQFAELRITANVSSPSTQQAYIASSTNGGWSAIAPDGSFNISGLRSGKARLFIYAPGNPNQRSFFITRIERDGIDVTSGLEIQPGQSLSGLRVFVTYGTGIIRGTIKFEGGVLPANARLFVGIRREGSRPDNFEGGTGADARGHFIISNLAPGTYEVRLSFEFSTSVGPSVRPFPRLPPKQSVTVTDGTEAEITFTVDLKAAEGGPQ